MLRPTGAIEPLGSTSTIVGALEPVTFEQAQTFVDVGDVVFLYTDGVTEARRQGELFDEGRLFDVLRAAIGKSPQRICERVMKAVNDYSAGHIADDIAILVLRRR